MPTQIPTGAYASTEDVPAYREYLKGHMAVFPAYMGKQSLEHLLLPRAEGKWSRKQILGHLIDSALNNLIRFTRAPLTASPYVIQPYPQEGLVNLNRYQDLSLPHLLMLWESLNRQILLVVEGLGSEQLGLPVQTEDGSKPTLGWVFCDYVAHLEHHLGQIYS